MVEGLGLDSVEVIKVDVEGGELRVLAGAAATIAAHDPLLVVELNPYCLWRHGRTLPQDLISEVQRLYPNVYAVHGDGSFVELGPGRVVDDLLYGLGTTGGLADLIGSSRPLDLDGLIPPHTESPPEPVVDAAVAQPDEPVAHEWSPRDDLARVRRAVGWRMRALAERMRGR